MNMDITPRRNNMNCKSYLFIIIILIGKSVLSQNIDNNFPLFKIGIKVPKATNYYLMTTENVRDLKNKAFEVINVCSESRNILTNAMMNPNYQVLINQNDLNELIVFIKLPKFDIDKNFPEFLKKKLSEVCFSLKNSNIENIGINDGKSNIGNYVSLTNKITTPRLIYYSESFFFETRNSTINITINRTENISNADLINNIQYINDEGYDELLNDCSKLIRKNDLAGAREKLSDLIITNPLKILTYEKRADVNTKLKNYKEALNDANKILIIDSRSINGHLLKGLALYNLNMLEEAIKSFKYAQVFYSKLELYNAQNEYIFSFAEMYRLIGQAYLKLDNASNAIENLELAIELTDDSLNRASVYYNLGIVKSTLLKKSDEAIKNYTQAIKHYPAKSLQEKSEAYYNRGLNKRYLNDLKGAISDYNEAISLNPEYAKAYNNRGFVYKLLDENKKADSDFTKALKLSKDSSIKAIALTNILDITFQASDYERCIKTADILISISNQNKEYLKPSYYFRGVSKLALDNIDGCKDLKIYTNMGGNVPQEILKYCK
jgi:tetratricopeptide (TPR) repeat protein